MMSTEDRERWVGLAHERGITLSTALREGVETFLSDPPPPRCQICNAPPGLLEAPVDLDPAFGHYLAGFIDGEGSFRVAENNGGRSLCCRFSIKLREDDRDILVEAKQRLGIGTLLRDTSQGTHRTSKPSARWQVYDRPGCLKLVAVLDAYPLRAKKARDYAIWREAVFEWGRVGGVRSGYAGPANWGRMRELKAQIEEVRRYRVPEGFEAA